MVLAVAVERVPLVVLVAQEMFALVVLDKQLQLLAHPLHTQVAVEVVLTPLLLVVHQVVQAVVVQHQH
jgi:hypothetical protein